MSNLRLLSISVAAGAIIGLLAIAAFAMLASGNAEEDTPIVTLGGDNTSGFEAPLVNPVIEKPDMTLTDAKGQPYDLRAETDGRVTLLYVGYTHCPDVCPTQLANIAAALDRVDPAVRDAVTVVFATSDPARDTPEVLAGYLANFNPSFVGLTGSQEEMDALQEALGMNPATKDEGTGENYTVSHASFVIAYGDDNVGRLVFPTNLGVPEIEHDLTRLVEVGPPES